MITHSANSNCQRHILAQVKTVSVCWTYLQQNLKCKECTEQNGLCHEQRHACAVLVRRYTCITGTSSLRNVTTDRDNLLQQRLDQNKCEVFDQTRVHRFQISEGCAACRTMVPSPATMLLITMDCPENDHLIYSSKLRSLLKPGSDSNGSYLLCKSFLFIWNQSLISSFCSHYHLQNVRGRQK